MALLQSWPDTSYQVEVAEAFGAHLSSLCLHRVRTWFGHNNISLRVNQNDLPPQYLIADPQFLFPLS